MLWYLFLSTTTLLMVWISFNAYCLFKNYSIAVKIGVPTVISLVSPENPLSLALQTSFESLFRLLPLEASSLTRHIRIGWEFHDRYRTHQRLGDAWVLVTPARNWLFVADPAAAAEIFNRWRDFVRAIWMTAALSVFGPSISTADGQEWQRYRKLIAPPFNENNNPNVWNESVRQAKQMVAFWQSTGTHGSIYTTDDARSLALNVMASTAFQTSYDFQGTDGKSKIDLDKPMTYRESLAIILNHVLIVLVVPQSLFLLPFLPQSWQRVGSAISFFREYMRDQIQEERKLVKQGLPGTGSLVSNLVRAGDDEKSKVSTTIKPLSEDEILGNIFIINFAGHDTTAISTGYALLLLVANRDVQDWVYEEIDYYTKKEGNQGQDLDYNVFFPKLKRCMALLLETLRLYNPIPGVPKWTGTRSTDLRINDKSYTIPSDTMIAVGLQTLHTHPRYWSPDSLEWRPQRWIQNPASVSNGGHNRLEDEALITPEKGVYFPWAEGMRGCPGKKFAQVEFVATIATLLRDLVGEPVPHRGETMDSARQRVLQVVKDSSLQLLLQMRNPRAVAVRWKRRD